MTAAVADHTAGERERRKSIQGLLACREMMCSAQSKGAKKERVFDEGGGFVVIVIQIRTPRL